MTTHQELMTTLKQTKARWTADKTPLSDLTRAEKARRLGAVVDRAALATAMAPRAEVEIPQFDQAVDWRNRNGNRVTPVKDQGWCGSCTTFAVVGTVEAMALIELGQTLDLSEADLHFCSSHGATCDGWWPNQAYESFKTRGVTSEANFLYNQAFSGANPFCTVAGDRDTHAVKVTDSTTLQSVVARKNWLTQVGPCTAALHVFEDFFSYRSGVYHHVSGKDVGLHNEAIVGYSEAEQCWICKNSWGMGWGMQGFFKIAYGECSIDTEYPFWTARGVQLPIQFGDGPGVVTRIPTHRDIFVRGLDNELWQKWWDNASGWSDWFPLGGVITSAASVISAGPNHVDVYVRGEDHQLWQKWWNGTRWSDWLPLGGQLASAPGVVARPPNHRDVFTRGLDHRLWHKWWASDVGWSNWAAVDDAPIGSAPAATSAAPDHVDIYVRGEDGQLYQKWCTGSGGWSGWNCLGGELARAFEQ